MQHKGYSIGEVAQIVNAKALIAHEESIVSNISFDSRKIIDADFTLFFAFEGRRDGHDFIGEVYNSGVRNFIVAVNNSLDYTLFADANFLLVDNTTKALQKLTANHRKQFSYPVIGITGSNGKTIVKEWLYQLLVSEYNIIRSPKSYNSQIGVPLSVWGMTDEYSLAIIEAGISKKGEMPALQEIIEPQIGILTNIGEAHNEGFVSKEEKTAEKLSLFKDSELFVYSPQYLRDYKGFIPGRRKFTWGFNDDAADLNITSKAVTDDKMLLLHALYRNEQVECTLPFTDAASVENAVCCWATMLCLGYDLEISAKRLEKLQPVKMRLELKNGINNCSIIDDSYSSDISSLTIALDFLKQQNQHPKRTVILSDIPEAGLSSQSLYKQVSQILKEKGVDRLIGVGDEISKCADLFPFEKTFFSDTQDLLSQLSDLDFKSETVLLKGARRFEFEKVSKALTNKVHETVLEINLNALEFNLNYYKSRLKLGVKIMVMVKAFSYGSGSFEIANLLQFNKVDYLAVAYADEGVTLRKAGITLPIMVMNPDVLAFDLMVEYQLEPEIYSFRVLKEFTKAIRQKGLNSYPVHLKLDTGMHRLGFMLSDKDQLLAELNSNNFIKVVSAFSHLVASEDSESDWFTEKQIDEFKIMTSEIEEVLQYPFIKHISNTSGISRHPEAQFDMVRLGIGLYGFDSSSNSGKSNLETVTTLRTIISQIKELKPGDTVGYNRKGVLPEGGKIAVVKIGYADGYSRKLGNGVGKMWVNGNLVHTIGNICMDMCMLDVSNLNVTEGDEVIVFGEDVRVEEIAAKLETIPYEVLTGVSERVKRVYFYE